MNTWLRFKFSYMAPELQLLTLNWLNYRIQVLHEKSQKPQQGVSILSLE